LPHTKSCVCAKPVALFVREHLFPPFKFRDCFRPEISLRFSLSPARACARVRVCACARVRARVRVCARVCYLLRRCLRVLRPIGATPSRNVSRAVPSRVGGSCIPRASFHPFRNTRADVPTYRATCSRDSGRLARFSRGFRFSEGLTADTQSMRVCSAVACFRPCATVVTPFRLRDTFLDSPLVFPALTLRGSYLLLLLFARCFARCFSC
jgi:hypothetical protein